MFESDATLIDAMEWTEESMSAALVMDRKTEEYAAEADPRMFRAVDSIIDEHRLAAGSIIDEHRRAASSIIDEHRRKSFAGLAFAPQGRGSHTFDEEGAKRPLVAER